MAKQSEQQAATEVLNIRPGWYMWERPTHYGFGTLIRVLKLSDGRYGWHFAYEGDVRPMDRLEVAKLVPVVKH